MTAIGMLGLRLDFSTANRSGKGPWKRLEARAGPAREKALGDEAVVGFDHGDPRDIVVGGEDARGGDASSTLEPAAQHGVAEIADDLVLQRRRRGSVERESAPEW